MPSPLIEGRPRSFPIPTRMPTPTRFGNLGGGMADLVQDLTTQRIQADAPCHLDPDLDASTLPRLDGWRGALGQVSAAQSHLANNGVGPGDVFLFWGLFRSIFRKSDGRWAYTGPREHRIFGWLQVDEVILVGSSPDPTLARYPWLASHPHLAAGWSSDNTVYVGRRTLSLPGARSDVPGFGVMRRGVPLTRPESRLPSVWDLPSWFNPHVGGVGLTYHPLHRWSADGHLRAAARGQEFVADLGDRVDAIDWLVQVIEREAKA